MLKIFGSGKKKRTSSIKPGHLKIPIPMISGVQYADMTESQISTLIGGGNKGEPSLKKSVSSISSQKTNNTVNTEKAPTTTLHPVVVPSRSISSPPVLVMPKPIYSLPPTRFLLRNNDYEKTQVESNSSSDSEVESLSSDSSDEDNIIELFPSNVIYTEQSKKEINSKLSPIEESEKSSIVSLMNDEASATLELPKENHQSVGTVTRTSDDSIRQYISASGSPYFINSSVSDMNNKQQNDPLTFSSPLATSFIAEQVPSLIKHNTSSSSNNQQTSFVTASSFDTDLAMEDHNTILSQEKISPQATKNIKELTPNHAEHFSPSPTQITTLSPSKNKREKTPLRYNNSASSSSPQHAPKQTKVTRPASSSASSATIGLNVTPLSRYEKVPGNQTQSISSEPTAFVGSQNNNNHKNIMLENTSRDHSLAISEIQHHLRKMALNQDLVELKRTIDRMQQERISDREEHLNRVKEQKLREIEILEQIKTTKERLELAIAGKILDDKSSQPKDTEHKPFHGNTIEEEYMIRAEPIMKPSTSTSTARTKMKSNEALKQPDNRQQENNRTRGGRKPPNSGNRQDPYQASESYFPDMSQVDFEYMHHGPPQPPQPFFPPAPNNFRNPNIRTYHPDMDGVHRYELYDSPRHNIRMQPQQRRRRSKSMESQWLPAHEIIDPQYQQRLPPQQPNFEYDMIDRQHGYKPRVRSRKSSTHSARSSDGASIRNNSGLDLQSGYHSAAEEEDDCAEINNDANKERMGDRHHSDGEQPPLQNEDHRSHRYHRRQPPNGPMHMMYSNFAPPPHLSHMGMVNDNRDRIKMRPPHYGYNNIGNDYYPYMQQRVSPRMMAAFADDQQWNGHRPQWGNQKMYGMPPPQGCPPENMNGNNPVNPNNLPNGGNVNGPPHHLQDPPNENNFARRYPPQNASLQQTPQQSHGYLPMYGETPHILYI